jgi:hypothetical protein
MDWGKQNERQSGVDALRADESAFSSIHAGCPAVFLTNTWFKLKNFRIGHPVWPDSQQSD